MKLLHIKIFYLLLGPHFEFLRFPKHKNRWAGGGVKIPRPGYLLPKTVLFKIFLRFPKHKTGWGPPLLLTCFTICYLDQ